MNIHYFVSFSFFLPLFRQIKMGQDIYSLRRKIFSINLSTSLSDVFTDNSFTDVTLVSDDQIQFQGHKYVLSACSPVLKKLLLNHPHSTH